MTACQHTGACPHEGTIAQLKQHDTMMMDMLREVRDDLKEVKGSVHVLGAIQAEAAHQKEALTRAFLRIEILEKEKAHDTELSAMALRVKALESAKESYDAFINQVHGMKTLAWGLWTVLAGGLGLVVFRLFSLTTGGS